MVEERKPSKIWGWGGGRRSGQTGIAVVIKYRRKKGGSDVRKGKDVAFLGTP